MLIRARPAAEWNSRAAGGEGTPALSDPQINALTDLGRQVPGPLRVAAGHRVGARRVRHGVAHPGRPITTLYPVPDEVEPRHAGVHVPEPGAGLTRPITPMGLAAFRLIATSVASAAGHPPADPLRGPAAYRSIGQRLFVDILRWCATGSGATPC